MGNLDGRWVKAQFFQLIVRIFIIMGKNQLQTSIRRNVLHLQAEKVCAPSPFFSPKMAAKNRCAGAPSGPPSIPLSISSGSSIHLVG